MACSSSQLIPDPIPTLKVRIPTAFARAAALAVSGGSFGTMTLWGRGLVRSSDSVVDGQVGVGDARGIFSILLFILIPLLISRFVFAMTMNSDTILLYNLVDFSLVIMVTRC